MFYRGNRACSMNICFIELFALLLTRASIPSSTKSLQYTGHVLASAGDSNTGRTQSSTQLCRWRLAWFVKSESRSPALSHENVVVIVGMCSCRMYLLFYKMTLVSHTLPDAHMLDAATKLALNHMRQHFPIRTNGSRHGALVLFCTKRDNDHSECEQVVKHDIPAQEVDLVVGVGGCGLALRYGVRALFRLFE